MSVKLLDFLSGLSGALDLVSPEVVGHHKRVAYIAVRLALALGLTRTERTELFMAGLLHDVGGFTVHSRLAALQFEADGILHAEVGYRLLRQNPLLDSVAILVRHHHTPAGQFGSLKSAQGTPERALYLANVLNLADRVDVLAVRYGPTDAKAMVEKLSARAGAQFLPELVAVLPQMTADRDFWLGLACGDPAGLLTAETGLFEERGLSRGQLAQASRSFSQIIDFRSRFTATHSCGVAEAAVQLGRLAGLEPREIDSMRLAGNLHDLGKLAVPGEILDKPAPLDEAERAVMLRHPELTAAILGQVPGLEVVCAWASQHHEQLSGQGYPWGLGADSLTLGARLLAVADVFTALREDRPYRAGVSSTDSLRIMGRLVEAGHLDRDVVGLLAGHQREINARRRDTQAQASLEFREFYSGLGQ